MKKLVLLAAAAGLFVTPVLAQDKPTVASLLKQGYEIEAMMSSNAGPGILLEKDDEAILCFVAETPQSAELVTQYCKPVR